MEKINLHEKIQSIRHGFNARAYRKTTLKINYREGLAETYASELNRYIEDRDQWIKRYYHESIKTFKRRVEGFTHQKEIIESKIKAFDKRYYWKKRRYITSLKRRSNQDDIEPLITMFDQDVVKKRDDLLHRLAIKHPEKVHSEEKINSYKNCIKKMESRYQKQHLRIQKNYEKQKESYDRFIQKNHRYLEVKKQKRDRLHHEIKAYEDALSIHEHHELKRIEGLLSSLDTKKSRESLLEKQTYLSTKMMMHEQPKIHLSIRNLKMFFGGIKAVNDLSFDVKHGEIFGLIGPNGAGKTTVFNCITQFYKATGGSVLFRNKEGNIINLNRKKTHHMIGEGIARSFQNVELIWELSIIDNLLVASHTMLLTNYFEHMIHTRKMHREESVIRAKGMKILTDLGIQQYAYRSPYGLPYGILKKIELARTLMTDPTLIILDEPAAGLNDAETLDLANVIRQINKTLGITIFLVEHDMGLVMSICDTVCAISFGKMLSIGTPKEIQENPEVRKAYLGDDSDE